MAKFKDRLVKFMYGRYGVDHLSRLIIIIAICLLAVTIFWYNTVVYIIGVILVFYVYFRTFSKNISKRYAENQAYLKLRYKVIGKFNNWKARCKDAKTHKIYRCPSCSQKIRVPKGKGKISIKCPKCRIEFIKKT
ncbi:MAG: hypothetical protein IJB96_03795 [Lachnospira sp.]|nr:hypothetical protein [Lachnospira sp.]